MAQKIVGIEHASHNSLVNSDILPEVADNEKKIIESQESDKNENENIDQKQEKQQKEENIKDVIESIEKKTDLGKLNQLLIDFDGKKQEKTVKNAIRARIRDLTTLEKKKDLKRTLNGKIQRAKRKAKDDIASLNRTVHGITFPVMLLINIIMFVLNSYNWNCKKSLSDVYNTNNNDNAPEKKLPKRIIIVAIIGLVIAIGSLILIFWLDFLKVLWPMFLQPNDPYLGFQGSRQTDVGVVVTFGAGLIILTLLLPMFTTKYKKNTGKFLSTLQSYYSAVVIIWTIFTAPYRYKEDGWQSFTPSYGRDWGRFTKELYKPGRVPYLETIINMKTKKHERTIKHLNNAIKRYQKFE